MQVTPNLIESIDQLKAGAVFLVDKPLKWTSFDVVNKLRWLIRKNGKIKKIKVGHAGTLDPLASGLLVICVGKMTKQIQHIQADDKVYTGTIRLGQTTPSFDLETEPENDLPSDHISKEELQEATKEFIGEQMQQPPVFSAKKIDGKRAYNYARKGLEVDVPKNLIRIEKFELTRLELPEVDFKVECSKGTYLRSLANDYGAALGCGGYLKALRRTRSGDYSVEDAWSVEQFEEELNKLEPQSA
ncbi:tRNA pseudouridine(55) synthase TruB [Halocola ammonii]